MTQTIQSNESTDSTIQHRRLIKQQLEQWFTPFLDYSESDDIVSINVSPYNKENVKRINIILETDPILGFNGGLLERIKYYEGTFHYCYASQTTKKLCLIVSFPSEVFK